MSKKPPKNGRLLMPHILGHAEQEEILPGKNLSRVQQVSASWRNKAHHGHLIMWREPLASASKGTSQSTCKGLKTGRAAAPRHSGQRASLPQPVQGDSLTLSHRRGGSPTPHSCWHRCPKIIGTEVFQRLVESLGQPYLIKWWERSW